MVLQANKARSDQLLTYNFILVYLLFPSNSAAIFATFQCEAIDDPAQSSVLRMDFSVDCKSVFHQVMMGFAGAMIFLYPIGVPALYAYLLFYRYRNELQLLRSIELKRVAIETDEATTFALSSARANSAATDSQQGDISRVVRPSRSECALEVQRLTAEEERLRDELPDFMQKLILGYELRTYYFELIECFRKLAIVCLPVFFQPSGSVNQLIFGLMVCFLTFGAHMLYNPYIEGDNDRLAQLCQVPTPTRRSSTTV